MKSGRGPRVLPGTRKAEHDNATMMRSREHQGRECYRGIKTRCVWEGRRISVQYNEAQKFSLHTSNTVYVFSFLQYLDLENNFDSYLTVPVVIGFPD